eukprot:270643_1
MADEAHKPNNTQNKVVNPSTDTGKLHNDNPCNIDINVETNKPQETKTENKQNDNDNNNEQKQKDSTDKDKIIIILTGATGVIGSAIASKICSKQNVSLHLLVRNKQKAITLIKKTLSKSIHSSSKIQYHMVDLSSKKSINSFIQNFIKTYSYLDILINDAAIVPNAYKQSIDDEELQFSVNVMCYMRLMNGLLPLLINSGKDKKRRYSDIKQLAQYGECAKVVNVASQYTTTLSSNPAQTFNLSSKQKYEYNSNQQYKKCKAANRMLSFKAAQLWKKEGYNIGVYSCHPGVTTSNVLQGLGFGGGSDSAEQSAKTPVFCASSAAVGLKQSGQFFVNRKVRDCQYCKDKSKVEIIWNYCQSLV